MDIQEALIGKEIVSFEMDGLGDWIRFHFDKGAPVRLEAYGDCCSRTWIESIDAPLALIGTVVAVEEIEMPDLGSVGTPKHENVDSVRYYGLKITTSNGVAVLDYRNDSNGYYGGSLEVANE